MATTRVIKRRRSDKDGINRILLAARNEFCRAGLAGAKLDLIALEAGVSKQLIHHYFRTKAELYIAILDDISASAMEELANLDYENHDPIEALRLFLLGVFDLFVRWPFLAGLFNDQSLYGGQHIPECRELVALSPKLMSRLEEVLDRGQEAGDFRTDIDAQEAFAASLMVVIGCFTNGKILSSLVAVDFSVKHNVEHWRDFSVRFAVDALQPR
ncbi:MAG: TetR/AcrR family transcriptional regulator [Porticoccaceae bacterium]